MKIENKIVKSTFNWLGNKAKYIHIVNNIIKDREYNNVIEPFMGSANLLLNIDVKAQNYIGNDNIELLPRIYNFFIQNDIEFYESEFHFILNRYNKFSQKDDYYTFRDDWNNAYKNKLLNKDFIIRSLLLSKLCSNSNMRFNRLGNFNSGFRGVVPGVPFFKGVTIKNIVDNLNQFVKFIKERPYTFTCDDAFSMDLNLKNSLLIVDPPYLLSGSCYMGELSEDKDKKIIEMMINSGNDFIYFNNETNNGEINPNLQLLRNYNKLVLSTIDCSGQNRKEKTKAISEVMIYRLR